MPPWKPAAGLPAFVGERRLNESEIDLIARWANTGAPEGDPSDLPLDAAVGRRYGNSDPGRHADAARVPRSRPMDLTCSVISSSRSPEPEPCTSADLEFRPGHPAPFTTPTSASMRTAASRRLDEADPAPGYEGVIPRSADYPDGHLFGWTPGQMPPLAPRKCPRVAARRLEAISLSSFTSGQPAPRIRVAGPYRGLPPLLHDGPAAPRPGDRAARPPEPRYPRRRCAISASPTRTCFRSTPRSTRSSRTRTIAPASERLGDAARRHAAPADPDPDLGFQLA